MQKTSNLVSLAQSEIKIRPENFLALENQLAKLKYHSLEEYKHSLRVEKYAIAISGALGNNNYLINIIMGLSGRYHDLGKLAVPKNILKKDVLDESDGRIIQEHPIKSYECIVDKAPELAIVAQIVVQHHLWQKNCYPANLPSRPYFPFTEKLSYILSIADSMDARLTRNDWQNREQSSLKEYLRINKPRIRNKVDRIINLEKEHLSFNEKSCSDVEIKPVDHLILAEILEREVFKIRCN